MLVSLLNIQEGTRLPDPLAIGSTAQANGNELMRIDMLETPRLARASNACGWVLLSLMRLSVSGPLSTKNVHYPWTSS